MPKKLTVERQAIVEKAIAVGKPAYEEYKAKGLSTFTPEGRALIKYYWDAQEVIQDTLSISVTKTIDLIQGKILLSDIYEPDGSVKKAKNV